MTAAVHCEAPVKVAVKLSADVPQQEVRMNINALYESVTNTIIKEMEAGAVPGVKPWKAPRSHGSVMPHNLATGRPYSGINVPLLWGAADTKGYTAHAWMTYQQTQMRGATVRKGERGIRTRR
jgi:antirestriction protein ArdC